MGQIKIFELNNWCREKSSSFTISSETNKATYQMGFGTLLEWFQVSVMYRDKILGINEFYFVTDRKPNQYIIHGESSYNSVMYILSEDAHNIMVDNNFDYQLSYNYDFSKKESMLSKLMSLVLIADDEALELMKLIS